MVAWLKLTRGARRQVTTTYLCQVSADEMAQINQVNPIESPSSPSTAARGIPFPRLENSTPLPSSLRYNSSGNVGHHDSPVSGVR
jgi:hypothetical protein